MIELSTVNRLLHTQLQLGRHLPWFLGSMYPRSHHTFLREVCDECSVSSENLCTGGCVSV